MFTYLLTGSFGEYFLFYGLAKFYIYIALAWRHRYFLSKILFRFFTRSLGMRPAPSVHDDISPLNWYSLPLFLLTEEGATSALGFRPIISLFLPFPGDSLGLLSLSPGHRVQTSVGFISDLDLLLWPKGINLDSYSSLNGHSLAAW